MIKLYANKATKQIGVITPRNPRFDSSIGGIEGSYYDEKSGMWILPESEIDELEYHLERIFGYSYPAKKSAPAKVQEPGKVIQLPDKKEVEPTPEPKTEQPAKVIQMENQERKPDTKSEPAPQQEPKAKDGKNWLDKLMDEYNQAKKDMKTDQVKVLTAVGKAARNDPELQALIELPHKTIERMNAYIFEKARKLIMQNATVKTSQGQGGYVDDEVVYEWAIAYFFEDDKAKIEAEEKKKAEDKAKREKLKKEQAERDKKRKEKEAKKAEKEAKAKAKTDAEAPKTEETAPVSEPEPAEPESEAVDVAETVETDPIVETEPTEEPDEPFDDQLSLL